MTAAAPYLSFCIPTRNRAPYLRVLLESIAQQSKPEIEVVISDDASTDETSDVVESYRTRFQLTYERMAPALRYDRNLLNAVHLARGRYCWLFGDDDRLEPDALTNVLRTLRSLPHLTGLTTDRISFDSALQNRLPVRELKQRESAHYHDPNQAFLRLLDRLGFLSCQIVRREIWNDIVGQENLEPYFTGYVQLYVIARMLVTAPDWYFLATPCVAFRADNDSFRALGQLGRLRMDVCGYEKITGDVFGRDTPLYHEAMAEISRTHARHHIVTAKRTGAPISFFWRALTLCIKNYGRYATFWLHSFPVLLMPRAVMLVLRKGYQRLRGHG